MADAFYTVYTVEDAYIGITTKSVKTRVHEHCAQAIRNCATHKDKLIFDLLKKGEYPRYASLFVSEWDEDDIQQAMMGVKCSAEKRRAEAIKLLAGQDELATTILFRDVFGIKTLNIAAGTTKSNVSRTIIAPPQSSNFTEWVNGLSLDDYAQTISDRTLRFSRNRINILPASQVQAKARNSVTWNDQETIMVVTPTRIEYGPRANLPHLGNVRVVHYKWRNTHHPERRNYEHDEPYVDTYKVTDDMNVGEDYIIFTEKKVAPDSDFTKCWWWGSHSVFDTDYVLRTLKDRLKRVEAVRKRFPTWDVLDSMETQTLNSITEVQQDSDGGPLKVGALVNYL